ncbi:hypothetical protein [Pseudorhodoferax sp. Leaf267]|uniref:hypothetical protein n=1 Tax=Pseudorhodoferax sp. Leaf267 TaxID=1736316 RepID=UPI0012E2CF89|nr:hypothetical protein [Pseudorhodoferax sp. Leaf267]
MGFVALLLHVSGFLAPAVAVALCTTLVGRWGTGRPGRMRWWVEWALSSLAGGLALLGALWMLGHDGTIAGYSALVACCATLAWLLSLRGAR